MSNASEIQNSLFETMKVFSDYSSKPGTVTIECKIVEVIDAGLGKYKVDYLGNKFDVYSNNSALSYNVDDNVYVLVPDNDFGKNKIIIGSVTPTTRLFVDTELGESMYEEVSDNFVISNDEIIINSYTEEIKPNTKPSLLEEAKELLINYFNDYRTLKLSANIRTDIPIERQRSGGNYGIRFNLPIVIKSGSEEIKTNKVYQIDVGNMVGTPYSFEEWIKQEFYFTLEDNCRINAEAVSEDFFIEVFCGNFPKAGENKEDIFIKDINLQVVTALSEDETSGYCLTLKASQGEYFTNNIVEAKTITPTLRVNGRKTLLGTNSEIYWFVEDASINSTSRDYLSFGGYGWACLNEKTNFTYTDKGTETFDYVSNVDELIVERKDAYRAYKCVIIYNKVAVSATIKLKVLDDEKPFILSTVGNRTTYQKNAGIVQILTSLNSPLISCTEENRNHITYSIARYDKNGKLINDNENFFKFEKYNVIENNRFVSLITYPVYELNEMNTIKCTVKINGNAVYTESLTVTTEENLLYRLVVSDADRIYKYDTNGNSPLSSAYSGPLEGRISSIPALDFKLYHADGEELTAEEYKYVHYTWAVPKKSMLAVSGMGSPDESDGVYNYFKGWKTATAAPFTYTIANRFNMQKSNNTIIFTIVYGGVTISQNIVIGFLKEGQNGTNGTSYSARIMFGPNKELAQEVDSIYNGQIYKMRFLKLEDKYYYYDYNSKSFKEIDVNSSTPYKLFINFTNNGIESDEFNVSYSIVNEKSSDKYYATINNNSEVVISGTNNIKPVIIQAEVTPLNQGKEISNQRLYCYCAVELTEYSGLSSQDNIDNLFIPSLDGGFSEVMYASDGTSPQWNENTDFYFDGFNAFPHEYEDYLSLVWEVPGLGNTALYSLRVDDEDAGRATIKPKNKYIASSDVEGNNEITVSISAKRDIKDILENKEEEKDAQTAVILTWDQIEEELNAVAAAYTPKEWLTVFNEEGNPLFKKNKMLNLLDEIIDVYPDKDDKDYFDEIKIIQNKIKNFGFDSGTPISAEEAKEYLLPARDVPIDEEDYLIQMETYNTEALSLPNLTLEKFYDTIYSIGNDSSEFKKGLNNLENSSIKQFKNFSSFVEKGIEKIKDNPSPKNATDVINSFYTDLFSSIFAFENDICVIRTSMQNEIDENKKLANEQKQELVEDIEVISKFISEENTTKDVIIKHHRPIVMYFNRYEMSNINGWDGNKVEIADGHILTPQIGAGQKNNDNSFTGVLMGLKEFSTSAGTHIRKGLFGYNEGVQSFVLDAENGAAIFGKSSAGQIIIDPSQNKAMLYSSNYFKNYNNETGLPSNYDVITNTEGMLLNLTDGLVHFGTSKGKIYSGSHSSLSSHAEGFYLSHDGFSIGSKFKASSTGVLEVGNLSGNHWEINGDGSNSYIKYGTKGSGTSVYIGTDEIKLGSKATITNKGVATFKEIYASDEGTIGGWTIDGTKLIGGNTTLNSNGTINCSNLIANTSGTIGGWNIGSTTLSGGNTTLNSNGTITCKELIANTSGTIGGWNIGSGVLSSGQIQLNGLLGSLTGGGWELKNGNFTLGGITYSGNNTDASLGSFSASTGFGLTGTAKKQFDTLVANKVKTDFLELAGIDVDWRRETFLHDVSGTVETADVTVLTPNGQQSIKVPTGNIRFSTTKYGIVYLGKQANIIT